MTKIILSILVFQALIINVLMAQNGEELEKKRGFRDILLDSPVYQNEKLEYKKDIPNEESEKPFVLYEPVKGFYEKIGEIPIIDLKVLTFDDKIIRIILITPNDPAVMKALKLLYGEPVYSVRAGAWEWHSEHVSLSFSAVRKKRVKIIYNSKNLKDYIREIKEEKINDVSSDF